MTNKPERQQVIDTLRGLIDNIRHAMLVTTDSEGQLRSRPMCTAGHKFDGDIWFVTCADDPKVGEIAAHPQVNVCYGSPTHDDFVSLSGSAEIVKDRKKIEALWNDHLNDWFPDGFETPNLALIRVDVHEAEYWKHHSRGMKGMVRSLFTKRIAEDHERITWEEHAAIST
ncbi:pyridoxamine 5'-phosphate oxidase family protein [Blastopirellula sp. JC732]|uniref:Pyridoxamine 5'-phosphate oxidase family protein n=1 Tax=Blastopirellula sediminis TaxID=2894196 RepID=A0A9X1MR66_9BACT|nr:pyridoxamine 5'-phosphate oxidase family protein [Blastopirellula sediminis]MCC9605314.1 pyridoxamine 5'-phosphate oxidase family protein [Blastopirellula sediminis]MCC9631386.1 pyridoxamine 5'-phosphate oxidase family protein [Blastopirellula sediminis]